jgi:hypothetical protein
MKTIDVDYFSMKQVGKAIKELDEFRVHENYVGTKTNVNRLNNARKHLINVLFSSGYELELDTYKLIRSKRKRKLL